MLRNRLLIIAICHNTCPIFMLTVLSEYIDIFTYKLNVQLEYINQIFAYIRTMLALWSYLLCPKLCWHNRCKPNWGQEVTYQKSFQLLEWHTIIYSIFSSVWLVLSLGHLYCTKIILKMAKWQSLWKYAITYCMSFKEFKYFERSFLASADIKVFSLPAAILLLIGLALFYTQGVFV